MKISGLCVVLVAGLVGSGWGQPERGEQETGKASQGGLPKLSTILFGAAYYNEYEPTDHLAGDIKLMKEAGLNVVRMGESTWSLWEPEDGRFE